MSLTDTISPLDDPFQYQILKFYNIFEQTVEWKKKEIFSISTVFSFFLARKTYLLAQQHRNNRERKKFQT